MTTVSNAPENRDATFAKLIDNYHDTARELYKFLRDPDNEEFRDCMLGEVDSFAALAGPGLYAAYDAKQLED